MDYYNLSISHRRIHKKDTLFDLYNPINFKVCHLIGSKNALTALLWSSLICFLQLHAASNLSPKILIELSHIEIRDGSSLVDHHGYGRTVF